MPAVEASFSMAASRDRELAKRIETAMSDVVLEIYSTGDVEAMKDENVLAAKMAARKAVLDAHRKGQL